MATDYYVDADSGSDSNDGTSWAQAKKHIQAAVDLITGFVTDETIIHLKSNTTATYTEDVEISGVRSLGKGARLVIQPEVWNEANYEQAKGDPFNETEGAGDFDIKADKPVILELTMRIHNSDNVDLHGLCFESNDSEAALAVQGSSIVGAKYCRFDGLDTSAGADFGAKLWLENNYFLNNRIAAGALNKSFVLLVGDNYIEDPVKYGIYLAHNSTLAFTAWPENPSYFTAEIKTLSPKSQEFHGVRLVGGSFLCISDQSFYPGVQFPGRLHVRNAIQPLYKEYYGIMLESKSMVFGASNMSFTTLNAKGEQIDMPEAQQIVCAPDEDTTLIY
jgi:hypothetical protein